MTASVAIATSELVGVGVCTARFAVVPAVGADLGAATTMVVGVGATASGFAAFSRRDIVGD